MIIGLITALVMHQAKLPRLTVEGRNFVDPSGKPVLLKGCNVGNWLVNEFWMLGLEHRPGVPTDQWSLEQLLTSRFGRAEDERLMNVFRSSWMTERDWQNIQSYRFNLVRIPFNYRLLEDDDAPKQLRPDAFYWLDKAVDEADKHGLYVVLDLHGVQGGQTLNDHTGRSGQNKLWSVPENQDRMAWLWRRIAQHFRGRNNVIAYDPMNEPYGGTKSEVVSVFKKAYAAIRSVDPDTLIWAHGATDNFDHFGDPKANGWHNVGFQMHYYPGLFGDAPTVKSNVRHLAYLKAVDAKIAKLNVPFYVGEMNVVLQSAGGAAMMRRVFDEHAKYGFLTTMWSYKIITNDGGTSGGSWGMFTNAEPAPSVNFERDSEQAIESYFKSFATQKLMPYAELKHYLTADDPQLPPLPADATGRTVAPARDDVPGWQADDIGGALAGGQRFNGSTLELYGGGDDIWSSSDQFRFLSKSVSGDFDLEVTVQAVEDTQGYTKAGLMVRSTKDPGSATALISVFPSGEAQVAVRQSDGGDMNGVGSKKEPLPDIKLRLTRRGPEFRFYANGEEVSHQTVPNLSGTVFVGPFALSHSNAELAKITYRSLRLSQ